MKQSIVMMIRLILWVVLSPFLLIFIFGGVLAHLIIWTFDPNYNHAIVVKCCYPFNPFRRKE